MRKIFKIIVMTMFLSVSVCVQAMDNVPMILACATPVMAGTAACVWRQDAINVIRLHDESVCSFKRTTVSLGGMIALHGAILQGVLLANPYDPSNRISMVSTATCAGIVATGLVGQCYTHYRLNQQLADQDQSKKNRDDQGEQVV